MACLGRIGHFPVFYFTFFSFLISGGILPVYGSSVERGRALTASVTTTASGVVLVGSRVALAGGGLGETPGSDDFHRWRFAKKPFGSESFFSTPSPSMPSFTIDREGLYVVELVIGNRDITSSPVYRVFSAVMPGGNVALAGREVSTPSLCAMSLQILGCDKTLISFAATAGDYSLNVINDSATEVFITLNGVTLAVPKTLDPEGKFSLPISLSTQNQLKLGVRGGVGSSVDVSIVGRSLPSSSNASPQVMDLTLWASSYLRTVRSNLLVTDTDSGQTHFSELLNIAQSGVAFIVGPRFEYRGFDGFKGREQLYVLTYDNGSPRKGVVSQIAVNVTYNTRPHLVPQRIKVPRGLSTFTFSLEDAIDLEGDELSYSIVTPPVGGALLCSEKRGSFVCSYTPPENFSGSASFTYKVSDGQVDSHPAKVTLIPFAPDSIIGRLSLGGGYSTALLSQGNVRFWGYNGNLRSNVIGDNEDPISLGDLDTGGEVSRVVVGNYFRCFLFEQGEVRCKGSNRHGIWASDVEYGVIDFGTSLKVADLSAGENHVCALFESGQIKCWGSNSLGQLGLGHTRTIGRMERPKDVDFLALDLRATALADSLGRHHSCALFAGGKVICWGRNLSGQLGQGHTRNIGDDELLSGLAAISLGGVAVQVDSGEGQNCALLDTNQGKCWGDGFTAGTFTTLDLAGVNHISFGSGSACALLQNGSPHCWGTNTYGQLGLGHTRRISISAESFSAKTKLLLPESEAAIDLGFGDRHACALTISGKVYCWGRNRSRDPSYGLGLLGLGHVKDIGDNETLEEIRPVNVGGTSVHFYPRFTWTPRLEISASGNVQFDATQSYAKSAIASYAWDFGDDSTATGATATHSFTTAGDHQVRLTIADASGASAIVTKTVRVQGTNSAPFLAKNLFFEMSEDGVLEFNLDAAKDWDTSDTFTYTVGDAPGEGTLSHCLEGNSDLACRYVPPTGFTGQVSFSYLASDGTSPSLNAAVVTIDVLEDSSSEEVGRLWGGVDR